MEPIAIVGYAMTEQSAHSVISRDDMIFACVKEALESTGVTRDEIDTVISCANDFYDGHTISQVYTIDAEGAYAKDESKVEQDGLHALIYAGMRLLSGSHKVAMVVSYSRASDMQPHAAVAAQLDPIYDRQFGFLNDTALAALQARAWMARHQVTDSDLALYTAQMLANGGKNPKARARKPATADQVLGSAPAFTPLRELMVYPDTDGVCVAILAAGARAKKITKKPVWIRGMGWFQERYYAGERDFTKIASATAAARMAFKAADAKPEDIDFIELSDHFAHQGPMLLEAMGFAKAGKAAAMIREGQTRVDGKLPVNPSGGALPACALCAVGLVRAVECARQFRGEAENKVKGAKLALAHGQTGLAAQNNAVVILGR